MTLQLTNNSQERQEDTLVTMVVDGKFSEHVARLSRLVLMKLKRSRKETQDLEEIHGAGAATLVYWNTLLKYCV